MTRRLLARRLRRLCPSLHGAAVTLTWALFFVTFAIVFAKHAGLRGS